MAMNNVINWLLEDVTPEIKYRTMTELLAMSKTEPEVRHAYDSLINSNAVRLIMDKFNSDNKWCHIEAFIMLAEFGLTRDDVPIDNYMENIIKNLNSGMKCSKILLLRNLVSLGYYEHPWVKKEVTTTFSTIREDGTFRCLDKNKKTNDSKLSDMGCYRQTTSYLLLAAEMKKIGIVLPQFEVLISFYMNQNVAYHTNKPEKVITKEMAETFYPIDHVHIGIQMIMYSLSILGAAHNPNCEKAKTLLASKKDGEGKYILSKSFDTPYFNVGKVGEANKWVTLYSLLSEK